MPIHLLGLVVFIIGGIMYLQYALIGWNDPLIDPNKLCIGGLVTEQHIHIVYHYRYNLS